MEPTLAILFEDNHCIAVSKPAPLLTQGVPPGIATLESMVKTYIKDRYHKPGKVYLGIPHRLDRPVSGVVLFARNTKAARRLAEQFQQRQVEKTYWAAVSGKVEPPEGTWEDWLLKLPEQARAERATADTPKSRRAVLAYKLIGYGPDCSILEIRPETGRMHQIRVQAALRGWPILGDVIYGSQASFGPLAELSRDRVIALHARQLTFLHPIRYEPVTVAASLPDSWSCLGFPA